MRLLIVPFVELKHHNSVFIGCNCFPLNRTICGIETSISPINVLTCTALNRTICGIEMTD